jgi:threonyl-tRNA synthetase
MSHQKATRRPSEFVRFVAVDLEGGSYEIVPEDFSRCELFRRAEYELLKQFVSNELGRKEQTEESPKHIEYMRRHELLDYCEVSEKGHYKWYPNGLLIQKLLLDYASGLAAEWGAFEVRNPIMIRSDCNVVGELMGEFHERDYKIDGGRGIGFLRYASDPLAFPFMRDVRFTYRQSPLKVYEEANCFRNEQEGEVSGLKRVRSFMMTDMHAACSDPDQARDEFERLCIRFGDLMNDVICRGRWVLGWEGTIDFFEANREWLVGIGMKMKVPAFFKLMPRMSHYYAMKNEYQVITEDKSNIQVSTVQWDVKDGDRFDIGYIGDDGRKHPCPVIIHASSFGSIERTLCAILENIAVDAGKGIPPIFPLWLSPTHVRIVPVSDEYQGFAEEICTVLSAGRLRVDIDDRGDTVGKKIRNGERDWVPYMAIVGEQERSSGLLSVRMRREKTQGTMNVEELIDQVAGQMNGMPLRPLPLPKLLSRRPVFYG